MQQEASAQHSVSGLAPLADQLPAGHAAAERSINRVFDLVAREGGADDGEAVRAWLLAVLRAEYAGRDDVRGRIGRVP